MAKKPSSAASAKAAKQKKTLIVLSCVLLVTGVYAFHTMQGLHGKTPSPVAASVKSLFRNAIAATICTVLPRSRPYDSSDSASESRKAAAATAFVR